MKTERLSFLIDNVIASIKKRSPSRGSEGIYNKLMIGLSGDSELSFPLNSIDQNINIACVYMISAELQSNFESAYTSAITAISHFPNNLNFWLRLLNLVTHYFYRLFDRAASQLFLFSKSRSFNQQSFEHHDLGVSGFAKYFSLSKTILNIIAKSNLDCRFLKDDVNCLVSSFEANCIWLLSLHKRTYLLPWSNKPSGNCGIVIEDFVGLLPFLALPNSNFLDILAVIVDPLIEYFKSDYKNDPNVKTLVSFRKFSYWLFLLITSFSLVLTPAERSPLDKYLNFLDLSFIDPVLLFLRSVLLFLNDNPSVTTTRFLEEFPDIRNILTNEESCFSFYVKTVVLKLIMINLFPSGIVILRQTVSSIASVSNHTKTAPRLTFVGSKSLVDTVEPAGINEFFSEFNLQYLLYQCFVRLRDYRGLLALASGSKFMWIQKKSQDFLFEQLAAIRLEDLRSEERYLSAVFLAYFCQQLSRSNDLTFLAIFRQYFKFRNPHSQEQFDTVGKATPIVAKLLKERLSI
ncbi:hypothetical protein GEMRC1_007035 [Eukaryota sp. GEM-RC1]